MEKFLRSNNFARVMAIFIAVILWLFVTGDQITRETPSRILFQVPLRVDNLNPEYVVTDIPTSVDITLEGLPEDFDDLTVEEIGAFVDLNGREPGNHLIPVHGQPPRGLTLISVQPEQVRVSIEVYRSEDFEVELNIVGAPATGWELAEYEIIPEEVLVGAPSSIFERVDRVVLLINISGMRLIESVELTPIAYDEDGNRVLDVVIDPSLITVRLEFERIIIPESNDNE
ncbi:MAG: CdaR family protein [Bacillota bacterium]